MSSPVTPDARIPLGDTGAVGYLLRRAVVVAGIVLALTASEALEACAAGPSGGQQVPPSRPTAPVTPGRQFTYKLGRHGPMTAVGQDYLSEVDVEIRNDGSEEALLLLQVQARTTGSSVITPVKVTNVNAECAAWSGRISDTEFVVLIASGVTATLLATYSVPASLMRAGGGQVTMEVVPRGTMDVPAQPLRWTDSVVKRPLTEHLHPAARRAAARAVYAEQQAAWRRSVVHQGGQPTNHRGMGIR